MTDEPDFVRAKQKITDARNWRGDVNVSLGDETVTFKHRLLNENEFIEVKQSLDIADVDLGNVGQTESQERLLELQQKEEELTAEEEEELVELSRQVARETGEIEEMLGTEGYEKLMWAGKIAISPSEEDVEYVYDSNPSDARDLMGVDSLPNPLTKGKVRDHLEEELVSMITEQPYPIKLNVGMQAFMETVSVLGNGLQE